MRILPKLWGLESRVRGLSFRSSGLGFKVQGKRLWGNRVSYTSRAGPGSRGVQRPRKLLEAETMKSQT